MSSRPPASTIGIAAALLAASLGLGCGGAAPVRHGDLAIADLIAADNLAFFLDEPRVALLKSIALDPGGERLLTGDETGRVVLRRAGDGGLVGELARHDGGAVAAFSPDGARIATAAAPDGMLTVFDARTGERGATCPAGATTLAFSPDGAAIAAGGKTGNATICNAGTGEVIATLEHVEQTSADDTSDVALTQRVTAVAWSADGETIATAGTAGTVGFWDAKTHEHLRWDLGHAGTINGLSLAAGDERLGSFGADGMLQVLTADEEDPLAVFHNESVAITCAAFSPTGDRLAWGDGDGRVKIWHATDGTLEAEIAAHEGSVVGLVWLPEGDRLITTGADGTVTVWSAADGERLASLVDPAATQLPQRAAWSPDGARIASSARGDGVAIWSPANAEPLAFYEHRYHEPLSVAWRPDGVQIASGGRGETIRIWNVDHGVFVGEIRDLDGPVVDLSWSPGAERIAAAGWGGIHVFGAGDARLVFASLAHDGAVSAIAHSPDGALLATAAGDGAIKIWDADDGTLQRTIDRSGGAFSAIAWSPDSAWLAAGSADQNVLVHSAEAGEVELELTDEQQGQVHGLAYSPDGQRIAVVDGNGTVLVWPADGKGEPQRLADGQGFSWSVEFDPSGELLLVAEADRLRIHRLSDGAWIALLSVEGDDGRSWLVFDDRGRFCGDEAAFGRLTFRVRDDLRPSALIPIEKLIPTHYREGLLADFLAGKSIRPPGY
jgi:WD40 repeat protein